MRNSLVIVLTSLVVACSKPADAPLPPRDAPAETSAAQSEQARKPAACELVTAAEMSVIVGSEVTATADDASSVGVTKCAYQPSSGRSMPMIELNVEWGMAEAAMVANSMLGRMENGELNDPLAGVGDQAFAIGPEAMVRRGEDLVRIMVYGTDDSMAATKRIFDLAAARMP